MRLPPHILEKVTLEQAKFIVTGNPGQTFDISQLRPEWRFAMRRAPEADWCRAAHDFVSAPADNF